jgi:hypothetical protein
MLWIARGRESELGWIAAQLRRPRGDLSLQSVLLIPDHVLSITSRSGARVQVKSLCRFRKTLFSACPRSRHLRVTLRGSCFSFEPHPLKSQYVLHTRRLMHAVCGPMTARRRAPVTPAALPSTAGLARALGGPTTMRDTESARTDFRDCCRRPRLLTLSELVDDEDPES